MKLIKRLSEKIPPNTETLKEINKNLLKHFLQEQKKDQLNKTLQLDINSLTTFVMEN